MALKIGDAAPDFLAKSSTRAVRLRDFRGQWLVMYFYPRAFTPGCTRQARMFRDNYLELRSLGAQVIGVSTDDARTQCDFAKETGVGFPLVADNEASISRAYDVKWPLLPLAKRITYVVDPQGKIAAVFHHELQVLKHLDDVCEFLRRAVPASVA